MAVTDAGPQPRRFVVTGASGFLGRHLIDRLVFEGAHVVALSRSGTGRSDVDDVRVADYQDSDVLASHIEKGVVVVHLAARAHQVGERVPNGDLYHVANALGTAAVARACRAASARRLILLSSIGVNGDATYGSPFTDLQSPRPAAPYAVSKWDAEQAVALSLFEGETDFVILRPPLIYGPGAPGNFRQLLRLIAKAPLIPLGSVKSRRTFIGVCNLVDAILISSIHPAASRKTFVVADSSSLQLADTVRIMAKALDRSPHVVVDVPVSLLAFAARLTSRQQSFQKLTGELEVDSARFRDLTGWMPRVDPHQGLFDMARDFRIEQCLDKCH